MESDVTGVWLKHGALKCMHCKDSEYFLIPHGANKYSLVLLILFGIHLNTKIQYTDSNHCSYVHRHIINDNKPPVHIP